MSWQFCNEISFIGGNQGGLLEDVDFKYSFESWPQSWPSAELGERVEECQELKEESSMEKLRRSGDLITPLRGAGVGRAGPHSGRRPFWSVGWLPGPLRDPWDVAYTVQRPFPFCDRKFNVGLHWINYGRQGVIKSLAGELLGRD